MSLISVAEVQARWGYSEILDGTFASYYDKGFDTPALRQKRRDGILFENLSKNDKYNLAFQCASIRVNLLLYFSGIESFDLIEIDRNRLGSLIVPPNVWKDSNGHWHPFSHYITTTTNEPGDARSLIIDPTKYRAPVDPILIGRSYQHPIMIDGYHRAAALWKFGPSDAKLAAFLPKGL